MSKVPGAVGYSELTVAAGHEGVRTVPLDGIAPSVRTDRYPYRGVEYAYTPPAARPGSLAAAFLAYLDEVTSQDVIREYGHLPCERQQELCG
ncbi:hypothetical protein [Streptomyces aquilus]|uniref:hypothetical protein n=1 Tax=Streptomyces aquilus TaxID=2548456 RepID=UPI0036A8B574